MPSLKGSIIEVLCTEPDISFPIQRSLHTYMINFGESEIDLKYEYNEKIYNQVLYPNDSIYMKPFIKFALGNPSKSDSNLFCVGISGQWVWLLKKNCQPLLNLIELLMN